jgi:hypothetical protein
VGKIESLISSFPVIIMANIGERGGGDDGMEGSVGTCGSTRGVSVVVLMVFVKRDCSVAACDQMRKVIVVLLTGVVKHDGGDGDHRGGGADVDNVCV